MANIRRDVRFPQAIADMILALMDPEPARRPRPADTSRSWLLACQPRLHSRNRSISYLTTDRCKSINHSSERRGHFCPAGQVVSCRSEAIHHKSVESGLGRGRNRYALSRITGAPREDIADWILHHISVPSPMRRAYMQAYQESPGAYRKWAKPKKLRRVLQRTFNHHCSFTLPMCSTESQDGV